MLAGSLPTALANYIVGDVSERCVLFRLAAAPGKVYRPAAHPGLNANETRPSERAKANGSRKTANVSFAQIKTIASRVRHRCQRVDTEVNDQRHLLAPGGVFYFVAAIARARPCMDSARCGAHFKAKSNCCTASAFLPAASNISPANSCGGLKVTGGPKSNGIAS